MLRKRSQLTIRHRECSEELRSPIVRSRTHFSQCLDQSITETIVALQPFDFELTKALDDLAPHEHGHRIEDDVRLTPSIQLNTNTCSPRTQGRDRHHPLAFEMYDERVREDERDLGDLSAQFNLSSATIEGQFELPDP